MILTIDDVLVRMARAALAQAKIKGSDDDKLRRIAKAMTPGAFECVDRSMEHVLIAADDLKIAIAAEGRGAKPKRRAKAATEPVAPAAEQQA